MKNKNMGTKNLSLFNWMNRRGSGVNLNLFRSVAIVVVLLLGVSDAWASSSNTYYSTMNVAVASGQTGYGTVYVNAAGTTSQTKNSESTSSSVSHSYNIYATANAGYRFSSWSGSGITFGSTTTANTTGSISTSSTSSPGTSKTATASFEVIQATAAPANIDLAPTDPSAIYPVETSERTLTFTTSTSNALTDFTNSPANGASGKFTFSNWRRVDATHVAVDYQFSGGGSYGGVSRTNSVTVSLKGVAHSTTKSCTITANFPNAKITDGSADEVFATYKSTDATQAGVEKTAVFDVEYVDGTNNFDTPTFSGAGASHFTYNSMSYADGKLTINYTYNGNKESGTHTATLTLKVNDAIGGTDATYGSKAITITAHNEEEATNDASVTPAGGSATEYATFAQALAAANGLTGSTLTLLRNVDLGTITATNNINKTMTIDLNGKELRAAVNAKQVGVLTINANVAVTIKDSKTGGRIINEYGKNDVLYTINVAKGTLNLESGTISIHNTLQQSYGTAAAGGVATSVVAMGARAIQQAAATTVNINGGRVESYGTRAVYGIRTEGSKANTTTLNISGGEIYAESPAYVYAVFSNGKLNVSGGTITAKINNEVVNENTAYMEYIRTNNKLWDNRTYGLRGFGYGILLQGGNSVTATSNYFGTLNMTGGTVNVINVGDPEMQANSTATSIVQSPLYGVYFNAAAINVKTGTASDGSYSQKYAAKGSITGGTVNVTNNGRQSYGVWVTGHYNSFDNSYAPVELKNCTINVSSYYESYGVYATAVVGTTSDNASPNMGACYAGEVELTGATVTAETTTAATAYALFAHAVVGNVYKNATWTKAKNAGYPRVYDGEFGAAAKITVNSGTYTATSATTTAYAVGSTTRAKTTLSSETSVAANRELGGNAEAYPVLILHGGTFRGETGTTTSGAVLSGGYTTIDGGTYTAYSGSTTSRGIYATAGTLDVSNVEISASGTTTAYGIDLSCGISDYTGFKYFADATLKNLTVTATTRTGNEADAVLMEVTKRPLSTTTYNALTSANKTNYGAIYQYGEYAVGTKCSIIGGTYKATSAGTTAYGVRMNSAAICEDVNGDGELAIGAAELSVKNATFNVETKGGATAYGIWAGGPATVDNSTFTVKTSTSDAFGIRPRYGKTTISNSTIDVTAGTATARGVYVDALMSTISTSNNTTHYCGVQGFEIVGELESNNNTITAKANGGNTAYAIQVIDAKGSATQTTAEKGLAFKGDHACAGKATINGGKYTATASGTTAYAIVVSDPAAQGEVTATPECIVNDGKFYGYATGGTYADVSLAGETGYFVLNGGYYVKDENLDKKLGEGMNKVAVKSGTPEYTEGYRWRVTNNMTGEIVCKVWKNTTLQQSFQSLEEALQYVGTSASSSNQLTIEMVANYTLSSGDYELPQYATLLIPYQTDQKTAIGTSPSYKNIENGYTAPSPFIKLIFAKGVNITVKGTIETSAVVYLSNTNLTTVGTGVISGKYGWLYLEKGAYIDMETNSSLQAWGFVTGEGEINVKSGATVYEDFQMGDWRGGSAEKDLQGNKNGIGNKGVFLITHYYYQNIECPITYRPGAIGKAFGGTCVDASSYYMGILNATTTPAVTMIGTSGSMFLMDPSTAGEDTWVRKEYDPKTDYVNWFLNSGAAIGSVKLTMKASIGLSIDVESSSYVLPITSNFNIIANYGDVELSNDVCFLPGSKLTIKKEANLVVPSGKRAFFYDQDDWKSYNGYWFYPGYSPSWKTNPRTIAFGDKTKVKMPDAEVLVEGIFDIQGAAYTTAGGANIHSTRENAGKVKFSASAPASTAAIADFTGSNAHNTTLCQLIAFNVNKDGVVHYEGKALNSVWLKNEDEGYTSTAGAASGDMYAYMEDPADGVYRWISVVDNGCFTQYIGSSTKDYIHPSDFVAVEANTNGDHAYHNEGSTRMFVNAEAASTSASCVWWEVDPTPQVISETTYYVANNDYFDNYGTYYYWDNSVSYWKPKKVTVTWNDKDGNKITNGTFGDEYDFNTSPVFHGTNPTWANTTTEKHDWVGWRDPEGNIYDKNAVLPRATADITYTAYFVTTKYRYTITFKNEDDSKVIWSGLLDAGDPAVCPIEPTQESTISKDYTFSNWVGYAAGATLPTITGPATYTAHYNWTTRQYHVTFYNYDAASVLYEADVDYNTRPVYNGVTPFRANTSAYSYEWTGWQGATHYGTTDNLALVTGDVYYVATFKQTELKYQVFFKRQDGSIIDAPFFSFEETPEAFPANPTMASTVSTDYTFREWSPATLVPVTEDGKVYTALFDESSRKYTAHFVNYNGTSLNADQTIDYNTVPAYTGVTPMKPNDSRNSYEFSGWAWAAGDGWEAGSVGLGEALPAIKGEITFTAQYTPTLLQFDVIYQREDGFVILRDKKKYGESSAFPITYTGATSGLDYEDESYSYTFDHWSPADVVNPVTANATYTAYYNQSIKTYSITAVGISPAGYGSVSPASLSGIPGGSTVTVNGNKLTVNGSDITATPAATTAQYTYAFDHWNNVPATVTSNISDIEAVFTRTTNTYTVIWKNGDTPLETDEEVPYGTTPTFDGDEPTKTTDATYGYTFDGWDDGTSVYAVDALPTVSGAVTYTAHYSTAPTVASVTVGGATTYYTTLQAAFNYAAGKTTPTITVLKAVSSSPKLTYTNSSNTTVTFDLNGYKVAGGANPLLYITGNNSGKFIIKDGSAGQTGQLYNKLGANDARACVHVYNCPTEFQSGTIYMENTSTSSSVAAYGVNVRSSRKFDMTGGTIKVVSKKSAQGIYTAGTTTVSNGTIDVTETANGTAYGVHVINGTTTINGNLEDPTYPKVSVTATKGPRGVIVGGLKPALNSAKTSVSQYNGKLYVNGGTYTVTASADETTAYGVYAYRNTYALNYSDNATCPGNYVSAGTATITAGDFTVTASGADATAYGVCIQSATSIQTALQEDGTTKYAKKTATPKGSITGGKYIVSGATKGAVNTSSAATAFTVQGGWYNIETGLATYTAPTVAGNYRVLDLTGEDPYLYEVAEAYTITFNNYDGTPLQSSAVKKGATPVYSGETPTKAEDASYTYSFTGWSPAITAVSAAATYTAQFSSTPKAVTYYYIDPETGEETSVSSASAPADPADYDDEDNHYTFDEWVADGLNYRAQYSSSERTYGAKLDIVDWTADHIVVNATNLRATNGGTAWTIKYASANYTKTNLAADRTVLIARDKAHETTNGYVVIKLQGTAGVESRQKYTVPLIYDENATLSGTESNSVVYVHMGATLTVNGNTTISKLYVSPGANVAITSGTLTITDKLVLRTLPWQSAAISGNFTAGSTFYTRIGPDKNQTIDGLNGTTTYVPTQYYQFALPFDCNIADVRLSDGTTPVYETTWSLKSYSESLRASQGSEKNNWVFVKNTGSDTKINAWTGYEFFSNYKYYREYYFPVTPPTSATTVTVERTGDDKANSGWNMICSPLMCNHQKNPQPEDIVVSWLNEEGGYDQMIPDVIRPAIPFFYQASADNEQLSFAGTQVEPSLAPIRKAVTEEKERIQWIHLDLVDANGQGDQTSIYSHPMRYDAVYQSGIDVAKQSLTASRAIIYSSHAYGEMAFAGVADSLLEQGVALTVYSPSAQELTFSMRGNDWLNRMRYVWLVDHETGARTDLLWDTYTFEATEGTARGRFTIEGVFRAPQITTDIENAEMMNDEMMKVRKVLINQKMYILRGDQMYDATGKKVSK